jgi:hypothetical protein
MHEISLTGRRLVAVLILATLIVVASLSAIAAGASTPKRTEHLTVFAVNTDGPKFVAIMSGDIADYGPAASSQDNTELTLHLTKGTFKLNLAILDAKLVAETAREPLYSANCSDYFKVKGSVTIVADSGTGAYRQIVGTFDSSITVNEDQGPPCKHASTPFRQILVLDGVGNVSK